MTKSSNLIPHVFSHHKYWEFREEKENPSLPGDYRKNSGRGNVWGRSGESEFYGMYNRRSDLKAWNPFPRNDRSGFPKQQTKSARKNEGSFFNKWRQQLRGWGNPQSGTGSDFQGGRLMHNSSLPPLILSQWYNHNSAPHPLAHSTSKNHWYLWAGEEGQGKYPQITIQIGSIDEEN